MLTIPKPTLDGRSIMITGGTGSFGKAFTRYVIKNYKPRRLVIFSRDELKQWEMLSEFPAEQYPFLRFFIGDVRDATRLDMAMRGIDYVIHAAALKQVPTAEYNPFECIHTNVIGAENIVQAAIRNKVQRVIALSTDKAANPINLYGASKLASDKIFVAGNNLSGSPDILFAVVRYGNVIGSRGSIVPLIRDLVAKGVDSLPITDPRMTRFWITLTQGVEFVLSCLALTRGGEIFVPKIPSMKIVDLAKALAPQLPHKIVGVRPGEKLHEVMVTEDDSRSTIELEDRYVIEPTFHWWKRQSFAADGAKAVPDGFRYASDTNTQWLDIPGLHRMLAESGL
jgi:UDP-N-acetylglucosamine 4,6-dehydratase/5-epimerase